METLLAFCHWLDGTAWSTALHESLYAYPLIESTHVLSIMLFAGTLMVIDLRLAGHLFPSVAVSNITANLLPWTLLGFVILIITGALLFYAIPVRTFHSVFFRVKVIVIVLAGINALYLHLSIKRNRDFWDHRAISPLNVRMVAYVSLACWSVVIVMGRMIAYNWFDCDRQPQSDFINWAASCLIESLQRPEAATAVAEQTVSEI